MKKYSLIGLCLLVITCISHAADTPASENSAAPKSSFQTVFKTLEEQRDAMLKAVQAKDTHALHQLDATINQEIDDLLKKPLPVAVDQTKKVTDALKDIGAQASAAHRDAHAAKWDDAATAQTTLAADLKVVFHESGMKE